MMDTCGFERGSECLKTWKEVASMEFGGDGIESVLTPIRVYGCQAAI